MTVSLEDALALEALEDKLRAILPEQYRDSYEDVLPVSMGSAGLKYDGDGRVAWDEMWATYCDLAMAGGPPHRGTLLESGTAESIAAEPEKYRRVVDEICRGISLVTGLTVSRSPLPGEVDVECRTAAMAGWLARAIVMENVMARHDGETLRLPAGPEFRLGREIKNVITAVAKTCHYWSDHMAPEQQESIGVLFAKAAMDSKLLEPASVLELQREPDAYRTILDAVTREITARTGSVCFPYRYTGWIGVECPDVRTAIWLMRVMIVENVLARREDTVLFLPVHPRFSAEGQVSRLVSTFEKALRLHALVR